MMVELCPRCGAYWQCDCAVSREQVVEALDGIEIDLSGITKLSADEVAERLAKLGTPGQITITGLFDVS